MAICGRYLVTGNFSETAQRIVSSERTYRLGLSCLLINALLCIFLAMGLYVTLKPIDSTLALFGLLFRMSENVLAATFSVLSFVAVKAYTSQGIDTVFTSRQLSSGMTLLNQANGIEFNVAMIFSALDLHSSMSFLSRLTSRGLFPCSAYGPAPPS